MNARIEEALAASLARLEAAARDALKPPPMLTVSEWAERHRVLGSLASPIPGRWSNARTPYLVEPMDALSDLSPVERVVMWFGAQLGKTETGNNWIGYVVDLSPAPMLVVQSTESTAKDWSKQRFADMVSNNPRLLAKIGDPKSRDGGNTLLAKYYPGGAIYVTGSNAPSGLRAKPIRRLFLDEVDSYPDSAGTEGDPIDLAVARTQAFRNRKILITSTCTIKGESRIEAEYEASDQRKYFVPCPHCGAFQILTFKNLHWPSGHPEQAGYFCEACGVEIEERYKPKMLQEGEWRPTAESDTRGYWLSSFYSPFLAWHIIAERFLAARGDPLRMQVVVNTLFAETWEVDDGEKMAAGELASRVEKYDAPAPTGVAVLTAGVDVQADRVEISVWGWGLEGESWLIEHRVLYGDPQLPDVWEDLDEVLLSTWRHPSGHELSLESVAIDSGYATSTVYEFTTPRARRHVYAIKGRQGQLPIWPSKVTKTRTGKHAVRIVGVDTGKSHVYSRLKVADPGPGYVHFPKGLPADYFQQLTVERRRTRHQRGQVQHYWHKPKDARNETFDCAVYAYAALLAWKNRGQKIEKALDRLSVSVVDRQKAQRAAPARRPWITPRPGWLNNGGNSGRLG